VHLIFMINKSAYKLLGKPVGFNTGRNIAALSLGCINGEPEPWKAVLKDERSVTNQHMRLANDEQRTLSVNSSLIKSDDGSVSGIMVTLEDITELEVKNRQLSSTLTHLRQSQESITQKNKELEVLASQDPLTGLNNRRSVLIEFQSQLDLVRSSEASEGSLACLMVDIDHFKSINDTYGHAVGDEVICAVANTMTEHCEPKDTVGRIGGEEFVMILPNGTEKPALVAERVREAIQRLPEDVTVSVEKLTASFGIAICEDSIETVEQFLDRADQALYHAKKNGRNRAVVYSEELFEGESPETAQEDSDVEQTEPDAKGSSVRRSHEIKAVDGFDELSGLPKREIFVEQVSKALKQERKGDDCVGLLSLSIRNLDVLSGSLGHEGIEQLTNDFITRIRDGLRHADLVSIIVNEHKLSALSTREYGILLNNLDSGANALTVVTRIQQLLSNPFVLDNKNVYLGAGIGVAIWPDDGADAQTLLDSVSQAQAQSLQSPDKVAFSFASAHQELLSRETLEIESDLHEALIRNQFTIQYQPKLDLAEQRIVGLEALIRWQHPIKGWISPADFIPVAESNGLILEISEFVLDESFTQLAKWHRAGFDDLHMSVNISATQLRDPSIVSNILGHVKNAKLAPQFFDAELTETAIIESPQRAKVALGQLQKAGMTISMDDFGIGYTSLALLADLPLDAVKIDRSFVSAMSRNERSHAIVGSIVNMAHTLDLKVVGEGIETSEQLAMLDALGCDVIQGYLICKPMAAQDMTVFLKEQSRMVKRLRSA